MICEFFKNAPQELLACLHSPQWKLKIFNNLLLFEYILRSLPYSACGALRHLDLPSLVQLITYVLTLHNVELSRNNPSEYNDIGEAGLSCRTVSTVGSLMSVIFAYELGIKYSGEQDALHPFLDTILQYPKRVTLVISIFDSIMFVARAFRIESDAQILEYMKPMLSALSLLCFSNDFVALLLSVYQHSLPDLLASFIFLMEVSRNDLSNLELVLRVLLLLCEKEDPNFLSTVFPVDRSKQLLAVLIEIANDWLSQFFISKAAFIPSHKTMLMSLNCITTFADNHNFKKVVVNRAIGFISSFLSITLEQMKLLYKEENEDTRDIAIKFFQLLVNLATPNMDFQVENEEKKEENAMECVNFPLCPSNYPLRDVCDTDSSLTLFEALQNVFFDPSFANSRLKVTPDHFIVNMEYLFGKLYCSDSSYTSIVDLKIFDNFVKMLKYKLEPSSDDMEVETPKVQQVNNVDNINTTTQDNTTLTKTDQEVTKNMNTQQETELPLHALVFVLGTTTTDRDILHDRITSNGGIVYNYISKKVTHYVCGSSETSSSAKSQVAISKNIPIVSEAFIEACLQAGEWVDETPYLQYRETSGMLKDFDLNTDNVSSNESINTPPKKKQKTAPSTAPAQDTEKSKLSVFHEIYDQCTKKFKFEDQS
eukprot:CAMPEP_0174259310 /NCGR_PEP_ID=MMETSP0439-20130205/8150_1 /TAXON_ID=0 /ORGANISM="Stereomyxa ramosa, Strain Chinc5" /LENGTH=651 /DNA_ID=CAMNT_0015343141 /DNA_START=132 /DNA_END=2087 /DNA_ORIENTATION=-